METVWIAAIGFIAAFITAVAGGGGVVAVPAMLAMGIPPVNVLCLNRLSDIGVCFGASGKYASAKVVVWQPVLYAAIALAVGSYLGSKFSISLPEVMLKRLIVGALCVAIILIFKSPGGLGHAPSSVKTSLIGIPLLVAVGFWSGAFGIAGGTFGALAISYLRGVALLEGRATHVVAAVPETFVSAVVLSLGSSVDLYLGVVMVVASVGGSYFGARVAVSQGSVFVRKAMVVVAILMIIKVVLS